MEADLSATEAFTSHLFDALFNLGYSTRAVDQLANLGRVAVWGTHFPAGKDAALVTTQFHKVEMLSAHSPSVFVGKLMRVLESPYVCVCERALVCASDCASDCACARVSVCACVCVCV